MEWNCHVSSSFCLKGGYFGSWNFKKVSTSTYKRCPLTGGLKCRPLAEKLWELQFHWCLLTGVSACGRCSQAEVQLHLFTIL